MDRVMLAEKIFRKKTTENTTKFIILKTII